MSSVVQSHLQQITIGQLPPVSRILVRIALTLAKWDTQRRSRLALTRLDKRLLADVGLDDIARHREIEKKFWQE